MSGINISLSEHRKETGSESQDIRPLNERLIYKSHSVPSWSLYEKLNGEEWARKGDIYFTDTYYDTEDWFLAQRKIFLKERTFTDKNTKDEFIMVWSDDNISSFDYYRWTFSNLQEAKQFLKQKLHNTNIKHPDIEGEVEKRTSFIVHRVSFENKKERKQKVSFDRAEYEHGDTHTVMSFAADQKTGIFSNINQDTPLTLTKICEYLYRNNKNAITVLEKNKIIQPIGEYSTGFLPEIFENAHPHSISHPNNHKEFEKKYQKALLYTSKRDTHAEEEEIQEKRDFWENYDTVGDDKDD